MRVEDSTSFTTPSFTVPIKRPITKPYYLTPAAASEEITRRNVHTPIFYFPSQSKYLARTRFSKFGYL